MWREVEDFRSSVRTTAACRGAPAGPSRRAVAAARTAGPGRRVDSVAALVVRRAVRRSPGSHDLPPPAVDRPGRTMCRPSIARLARRAVRRSPGSHDVPPPAAPGDTSRDQGPRAGARMPAPPSLCETSPPDDRSARARPHARAAQFPSGRNTPRARCRAGGIGRPGSPSGTDIARSRESGVQQHPSGPGGAVRGRPAPPVRQQRTVTRRAGRTRRALPAERAGRAARSPPSGPDTPRAPQRAGGIGRPSSPSGTDIAHSRERGVQLHPSGTGGAVRGRPAPPVRQPRTITRRAGRTRRALPAERADSAAQGRRAGRISPARGARGAGRGAGRGGAGRGTDSRARGARGHDNGVGPEGPTPWRSVEGG